MASPKGHKNEIGRGSRGSQDKRYRPPADIQSLARAYTNEATRRIAAIMRDENQPGQTRLNACKMLLDRGWGRPPETHRIDVNGEKTLLKVVNEIVHVHETREQIEFRDQVPLLELEATDGSKPN